MFREVFDWLSIRLKLSQAIATKNGMCNSSRNKVPYSWPLKVFQAGLCFESVFGETLYITIIQKHSLATDVNGSFIIQT